MFRAFCSAVKIPFYEPALVLFTHTSVQLELVSELAVNTTLNVVCCSWG